MGKFDWKSSDLKIIKANYSPDQDRDEEGKFADEGGGGDGGGGDEQKTGKFDKTAKPGDHVMMEGFGKGVVQEDGTFKADYDGRIYEPPPEKGEPALRRWKEGDKEAEAAYTLASASLSSPLNNDEAFAMTQYSNFAFKDLNESLRSGETPRGKIGRVMKNLDSAFSRTSLSQDVTGYRVVDGAFAKQLEANVGSSFTDGGFVSVTGAPDYVRKGIGSNYKNATTVRVVIPKGAKALPIRDRSVNPRENETLIARGSSFKVSRDKNGLVLTYAGTKSKRRKR